MTNLWQKTPAWLQAILLMIVFLVPIKLLKQYMTTYTLEEFPQLGHITSLLIAGILILYWLLTHKLSPFKAKEDIKLTVSTNVFSISNIASIIGLLLLTISALSLPLSIMGADSGGTNSDKFFELLHQASPLTAVSLLIAASLTAGIVEEITFRGFVQNTTNQKYPRVISYLIVGVLFSLMHFSPILSVSYIVVSVGFSIVADRKKSIGVVVIAHVLIDVFLLLLSYFNPSVGSEEAGATGIIALFVMLMVAIILIIQPKFRRKLAVS